MSAVEERISRILTDLLGIDEERITRSARFKDDLGADSLQIVEAILLAEEAFGIIRTDATENITTVGELVDLIKSQKQTNRKDRHGERRNRRARHHRIQA
jgi:acyl carrier protein